MKKVKYSFCPLDAVRDIKSYCGELNTLNVNGGDNCIDKFYDLCVDRNIIKRSYDKIYKDLIAKGLGVNLHYLPVHLHPVFKKIGFKKGDFPISEKHASSAFSIPVFYDLKERDQKKIVKILKKTFNKIL